nr:MAG TPA: hypothetical protein [Caudoviricetes sp.]
MINIYFPCWVNVTNFCNLNTLLSYSYLTILINLYVVSRISICKCKMIKMCSI